MGVRGLDLFRQRLGRFSECFVLIGGTACDLAMREAGLDFRATKDLDIVLCLETLNPEFAAAFWAYVRAGGYLAQETSTGERRFYRFQKPTDAAYPTMLELFSRLPDALTFAGSGHLTPIPLGGEVSSLSAILLDGDYYDLLRRGRREVDGLPIVGTEHLVPLKAKAFLDLDARRKAGEEIDSRAIRKHKNDVLRIAQLITPDRCPALPDRIAGDLRAFLAALAGDQIDMNALGMKGTSATVVLERLRSAYRL